MHSALTNICHLGWRGGENKLVKEGPNIKDDDEHTHHSKLNRKKINEKRLIYSFFRQGSLNFSQEEKKSLLLTDIQIPHQFIIFHSIQT